MMTFYIKTLGCSKNAVDSDLMIGALSANYKQVFKPDNADIIIVNTCGFIEDAKEESINALLDMARYKQSGLKHLIACGCLTQRYADDLKIEIPEIDAFIGTTAFQDILKIVPLLESSLTVYQNTSDVDRIVSEDLVRAVPKGTYSTSIKIAEGCDNRCTYCIIPKLRGKFRSRAIEDIVKEAKALAKQGVKEIILIAQDSSRYGIDLYNEYKLLDLLKALNQIKSLKWIRIQYMYPDVVTEDLIRGIASLDKIINYFDIPIQHAADSVLKRMRRNTSAGQIKTVLDLIKKHCADYVVRTTVIVGFPGETDEEFNELLDFIKNNRFDKLGAFGYSLEEDTPAFNLPNRVTPDVIKDRRDTLMTHQKFYSEERLIKRIGELHDILIEERVEPGIFIGRTKYDAPEIDGICYVYTPKELLIKTGDIVRVKITDALEYDLIGDYDEHTN